MKPRHRSRTGAQSELIAAAWLMAQGLEVFRNVSPCGPADLVAWRVGTAEKHLIDVKTIDNIYVRKDEHFCITVPTPHPDGVHYLVVSKGQVLGFWRRDPAHTSSIQYNLF